MKTRLARMFPFVPVCLMIGSLSMPGAVSARPVHDETAPAPSVIANDPRDLARLIGPEASSTHWLVRGVDFEDLGVVDLELRPVRIFAPDARIIIDAGARTEATPKTRFFRGHIRDAPGTVVALTLTEQGRVVVLATDGDTTWVSGAGTLDRALEMRASRAPDDARPDFECAQPSLSPPRATALDGRHGAELASAEVAPLPAGQLYQVRVAIETDHALFQRFGTRAATLDYIGTLFNYISGIYEVETQTRFSLGDVYLYESAAAQPWLENGNTLCRLLEFSKYWRDNRAGVTRTIAHFLSGQSLGGGIAFVNALCAQDWTASRDMGCATLGSTTVYGGYGLSANLTGAISDPSGIAWDGLVVAHEIGHNVGSSHTHCYAGVAGGTSPVDACHGSESGCWSGTESLPGVGSLTGGTPGARQGTIMSYCHQRSGGLGNIATTFGLGHPYGVGADRVSSLMANQVAATASVAPDCIPVVSQGGGFTLAVASSGTTGVAIGANPSTYAGTTPYTKTDIPTGTAITLTAPSRVGAADFSAWSGCDTTDGPSCGLMLSRDTTVTATYVESVTVTPLDNGETRTNLSGAKGSERQFYIDVPPGQSLLKIEIWGGSGDADLYVQLGAQPTLVDYACRPYAQGNTEQCAFASPASGRYGIMLHAWETYAGVSLRATHSGTASAYSLSVNASGAEGVAIAANPTSYAGTTPYTTTSIPAGTAITLTAPNRVGCAPFSAWLGCATASGTVCDVAMSSDLSLTAAFEATAAYPDAITLANGMATGITTHVSRSTITAGPSYGIATGAALTLEAGQRIGLGPGVRVERGGTLRAIIDPLLSSCAAANRP